MARKTIFLETAFWDKFSECSCALLSYSEDDDLVQVFEKVGQMNDMFSFICRSSVFVDSPLSVLGDKAKTDLLLKRYLKLNAGGSAELEQLEEPFPSLDSTLCFEYDDDLSAVYLTKESHKEGARKHGVINICIDNIWEQQIKFIDSGESVAKDQIWAWEKMNVLRENSNGMVVIDNYLLSESNFGECRVDWNIRNILELILPNSINEEYIISIFYYDKGENEQAVNERKEKYMQILDSHISQRKPNLQYKIELFPTLPNFQNHHKEFHDRTIVTNNIWLASEAGFDLLVKDHVNNKYKAKKTTKTHGLYFGFANESAQWLDKAYEQLILEAKNCLKDYGYDTANRLLL